jgi:WD40 repeat protein
MKLNQSLLIFITVASLTFNVHAPFTTITQTGDYDISGDISYSPVATNDTIIQISASNVRLNLGGHVISQGNLTAGLNGISVNPNLTDITIQNGFIQNLTGTGVGIGQGCKRITIDGITTFSCDNRGINVSGVISAPIQNSVIKNCTLNGCCQGAAGDNVLTLSHCVNLQVKDCSLNQNGIFLNPNGNQNTLDVAKLMTCTQCDLFNLDANDNLATSTIHVFSLSDAWQCIIKNCTTHNTGSAQDAFGAEIDGMNNILQQNIILNTYSTASTSSNTVAGISLEDTASGNQLLDNKITNSFALSSASANVFTYGIEMQNAFPTMSASGLPNFVTGVTVNAVAWSPNGRYLAIGESGGNLRVFEFANGVLEQAAPTFTHGAAINAVAWSADGRYVAMGGGASPTTVLRVFDFDGAVLTAVGTFTIAATNAFAVSFSPSGRYIAVGVDTGAQMRVLNFPASSLAITDVANFTHGATVNSVSWSPDEKYIAIGGLASAGVTTRVIHFTLDSAATTVLASAADFNHGATVQSVAFHPTMRWVAMGGASSGGVTLRALSFNGSSLTASNPANISTGATVSSVVWASDGRFLGSGQATGGGAEIQAFTWDGTTLVQAQTFSHGANVNGLDWIIGGDVIALGGVVSTAELKTISALKFPEKNIIKGNNVTTINGGAVTFGFARGKGIAASTAKNLVMQNNAFNNDINFHFNNNVFRKYVTNTRDTLPSIITNFSFPPL